MPQGTRLHNGYTNSAASHGSTTFSSGGTAPNSRTCLENGAEEWSCRPRLEGMWPHAGVSHHSVVAHRPGAV